MNIVFHLLLATILIAGMVLLRMLADRHVLQSRMRGSHTDRECMDAGCFRGCHQDDGAAPDGVNVAGQNRNTKRSKDYAH